MEHLDTLAAQDPDSEDLAVVNSRLQDPLVARQLKALGYTYHHIGSWWDPTRTDGGADVNHQPAASLPLGGDFVDALYDVSVIPAIAKRLGIPSADSLQRHYDFNAFGLDALEGLRDEPGPKFVLAHVLLPHGPFVFDEDGSYLGDDEAKAQGIKTDERYARQQAFTNRRLREIRPVSWPCPRRSDRSSSSRPTRAPGRSATPPSARRRATGPSARPRTISSRSTGSSTPGTCPAARTSVSTRR